MAYTRNYWYDKDDDKGVSGTPVDAEHMNNIEEGIQENSDAIEEVNADLTDIDIMGATGTAIKSGDDLNDYLTPGKYYAQNSSISSTVTNAPFTTAGFNLYVFKQVVAANTVFQLAVRTSTGNANILAVRICSAGTWGNWYVLSASALSTTSLSNKPEDGDV